MSADNAIYVWPEPYPGDTTDGYIWYVAMGFVSPEKDDCLYLKSLEEKARTFKTRSHALNAASDQLMTESIVEYGLQIIPRPPTECGECYRCMERKNAPSQKNS